MIWLTPEKSKGTAGFPSQVGKANCSLDRSCSANRAVQIGGAARGVGAVGGTMLDGSPELAGFPRTSGPATFGNAVFVGSPVALKNEERSMS